MTLNELTGTAPVGGTPAQPGVGALEPAEASAAQNPPREPVPWPGTGRPPKVTEGGYRSAGAGGTLVSA